MALLVGLFSHQVGTFHCRGGSFPAAIAPGFVLLDEFHLIAKAPAVGGADAVHAGQQLDGKGLLGAQIMRLGSIGLGNTVAALLTCTNARYSSQGRDLSHRFAVLCCCRCCWLC